MKPIITLKDEDIFPKDFIHEPNEWQPKERIAVRIIVIDEDQNIALCGTKYQLLPGGGVEEGEQIEESAKREVIEEVGCKIEIEKYLGISEEFRDNGKRHQITHCFVGKVIGNKGEPQSTQEDEKNMKVYWHNLEKAIEITEDQVKNIPFMSYNSCFNSRLSLAFLKEFKKQINER